MLSEEFWSALFLGAVGLFRAEREYQGGRMRAEMEHRQVLGACAMVCATAATIFAWAWGRPGGAEDVRAEVGGVGIQATRGAKNAAESERRSASWYDSWFGTSSKFGSWFGGGTVKPQTA